ncbi:MAG TPA: hypothetical protein VNT55_14325 [Baekduia sp.]|nr:hypothetical protein [Baekduia sp.]
MTLRPVALLGVILGLLVGIVAAIVIPQTRADDTATRTAAPPIDPGSNTVVRVAKALRQSPDSVDLRATGPVRIEARAADPLGGPEWAVRVFEAERVVRPGQRRHGVDPVIGHNLCAQLGRLHDGVFGWLEADGTFRPTPVGTPGGGSTSLCASRRPDLGRDPWLLTLSPMTEPNAPAARVKSTIAWGLAGTGARNVALKLAGRAVTPPATPHHAFLVAAGPELDQHQIMGTITYAGGAAVRVPVRRGGPAFMGVDPDATSGRAPRLAARAPDPNGGLPFAMIAEPTADGGWCSSSGGRIVGDRVGGVDYARDILTEVRFSSGGGCSGGGAQLKAAFRDHPVLMGWGGGGGDLAEEGGDTGGTGRIARRTQRGLTTFTGQAAPGVVSVTLETPRDVRTLIPSGPNHSIMAVYDGGFPTGALKITARFKDGHVQTDELPYLGM